MEHGTYNQIMTGLSVPKMQGRTSLYVPGILVDYTVSCKNMKEIKEKNRWIPLEINKASLHTQVCSSLLVAEKGAQAIGRHSTNFTARQINVFGEVIWVIDSN